MKRETAKWLLLILIATVLGNMRMMGHTEIPFQAIAHVFVGGCFGAWFVSKNFGYGAIAIGLTILEVAAFLWFKFAA